MRSRYRNVLFCESPGGECWNRKIYLAQHYLLGVDKLGFLCRFGSLCISRSNWDFSGEGYLPGAYSPAVPLAGGVGTAELCRSSPSCLEMVVRGFGAVLVFGKFILY